MGSSNKKLKPRSQKMKLATVLAATASVSSYIAENWWNEAVNVFNFAQANWDQFAAAVNSVSDSQWKPLWTFCNSNGDATISSDELTACASQAANYVGMSDTTQNFLYDFGVKYWSVVDADKDGALNYDEYKYTMAAFAAVDARVILGAFDSDSNGILTGQELTALRSFVTSALTSNSWNPSADDINAVKAAWANAQVDGDDNSASMIELSKFIIGTWNVLLQ